MLTQCHPVPTSVAIQWPSAIFYQLVPPYTDSVPPSTNHCCPILIHYPASSPRNEFDPGVGHCDVIQFCISSANLWLIHMRSIPTKILKVFFLPDLLSYSTGILIYWKLKCCYLLIPVKRGILLKDIPTFKMWIKSQFRPLYALYLQKVTCLKAFWWKC